jgi:hypothetical protein
MVYDNVAMTYHNTQEEQQWHHIILIQLEMVVQACLLIVPASTFAGPTLL